jgi:hypothetical protein
MHGSREASLQGCINALIMVTQNPSADQQAIKNAILKVALEWKP